MAKILPKEIWLEVLDTLQSSQDEKEHRTTLAGCRRVCKFLYDCCTPRLFSSVKLRPRIDESMDQMAGIAGSSEGLAEKYLRAIEIPSSAVTDCSDRFKRFVMIKHEKQRGRMGSGGGGEGDEYKDISKRYSSAIPVWRGRLHYWSSDPDRDPWALSLLATEFTRVFWRLLEKCRENLTSLRFHNRKGQEPYGNFAVLVLFHTLERFDLPRLSKVGILMVFPNQFLPFVAVHVPELADTVADWESKRGFYTGGGVGGVGGGGGAEYLWNMDRLQGNLSRVRDVEFGSTGGHYASAHPAGAHGTGMQSPLADVLCACILRYLTRDVTSLSLTALELSFFAPYTSFPHLTSFTLQEASHGIHHDDLVGLISRSVKLKMMTLHNVYLFWKQPGKPGVMWKDLFRNMGYFLTELEELCIRELGYIQGRLSGRISEPLAPYYDNEGVQLIRTHDPGDYEEFMRLKDVVAGRRR